MQNVGAHLAAKCGTAKTVCAVRTLIVAVVIAGIESMAWGMAFCHPTSPSSHAAVVGYPNDRAIAEGNRQRRVLESGHGASENVPGVILVRADSGFARDDLMPWCEANA
jgi:hypothetical protein